MKKVSVIMPIYNMCDKLRRGVMSIVNQTYPDIEIILVDDGSSDNSYEVCTELAEKYDFVHIFHTENQGSGKARNYGIAQATGEYLYFMDADDELDANALRTVVERMEQTGADLAVFGYRKISPAGKIEMIIPSIEERVKDGKEVRKHYEIYMKGDNAIQGAPWNKMFKTESVRKHHVEYADLRRGQDQVFIMRYVATMERVCFIGKPLYSFYQNDLTQMWKKFPDNYVEIANSLLQYRSGTILSWNPTNEEVKKIVYDSYLCDIIICMEILYNPQSGGKRKKAIIKELKKLRQSVICANVPWNIRNMQRFTQKIPIFLLKNQYFELLHYYTKLKLWVKKIIGVGLY